AVEVGVEVEVLLDRQVLVEAESLRHVGDPRLDRVRVARHVDGEDLERPRVRFEQAGGEPEERRLAGAVRPDERRERALVRLEGDVREGADLLARLAHEPLAHRARDEDGAAAHRLPSAATRGSAALAAAASGRWTVAGMPRRSASPGSLTKTRTS